MAWISVDDHLPTEADYGEHEEVLVRYRYIDAPGREWTVGKSYHDAERSENNGWMFGSCYYAEVSHWMRVDALLLLAASAKPQGGGEVPESELIALVAGPYHYHHKMDEAAEREGKAFDRCRELTIQNIRAWCATRRAMLYTPPPSAPAAQGGEEVYGLFRAIVDAGGPETIARHGVERGSREWTAKVRAGLLAIERQFHPERFDEPSPPSTPVWVEGLSPIYGQVPTVEEARTAIGTALAQPQEADRG